MVNRNYSDHPWTCVSTSLKEIKKLQTNRRYRHTQKAFFIEGVRNFVQVADNQFDLVVIVYSEKLLTNPLARMMVRRFRRASVPTVRVSPETFRRYSQTQRASGISAIVRQRWTPLHSISLDAGLCWLILGLVRSPGNSRTLIRTSEAVGGAGFILLDRAVEPYSPVTVRASMGALFRQHFVRTNHSNLKNWLIKKSGHVIGASPHGEKDFHDMIYPPSTLLFLGEERNGLSPRQRGLCEHLVRIPMVGQADSLNLGVAGSLLMYEMFRSRKR